MIKSPTYSTITEVAKQTDFNIDEILGITPETARDLSTQDFPNNQKTNTPTAIIKQSSEYLVRKRLELNSKDRPISSYDCQNLSPEQKKLPEIKRRIKLSLIHNIHAIRSNGEFDTNLKHIAYFLEEYRQNNNNEVPFSLKRDIEKSVSFDYSYKNWVRLFRLGLRYENDSLSRQINQIFNLLNPEEKENFIKTSYCELIDPQNSNLDSCFKIIFNTFVNKQNLAILGSIRLSQSSELQVGFSKIFCSAIFSERWNIAEILSKELICTKLESSKIICEETPNLLSALFDSLAHKRKERFAIAGQIGSAWMEQLTWSIDKDEMLDKNISEDSIKLKEDINLLKEKRKSEYKTPLFKEKILKLNDLTSEIIACLTIAILGSFEFDDKVGKNICSLLDDEKINKRRVSSLVKNLSKGIVSLKIHNMVLDKKTNKIEIRLLVSPVTKQILEKLELGK